MELMHGETPARAWEATSGTENGHAVRARSFISSAMSFNKGFWVATIGILLIAQIVDAPGSLVGTALAISTAVIAWRAAQVQCVVDSDGFEARNFWGTWRRDWSEITEILAVDAGMFFGGSIGVATANRELLPAKATIHRGARRNRVLYERLAEESRQHAIPLRLAMHTNGDWINPD